MIAALPMYDFGDLVAANDTFWSKISNTLARHGVAAPQNLTRGGDLWDIWQSPDLLLAQTCGYPYRARLHGAVTLVGTPDYGVTDCPPGYYCSYFIARADDPRDDLTAFDGARFAYNEAMSQSGWAGPQTHAQSLGITFQTGPQTGAHRDTARTVATGDADIGAVDAVTWHHMTRQDPVVQQLRIVGRTPPAPGLPLITAQTNLSGALFDATCAALDALPDDLRAILGLRGIIQLPQSVYLAVPSPPAPDQNG